MSTVFRERQRAARFAARVDGADRSVDGSLDARLDAELERLLEVVGGLRTVADHDASAAPRAAFAVGLRERLMSEAATVLTPQATSLALPARRHGRRERRLVAAATAAVLLGGSAGMAAASQSALPGQALYPVKRLLEKADVGLSGSDAGRGRDLLSQAGGRLDEVQGLMAAGPADASAQIPATVQAFTRQADAGARELLQAYADTHDPATIATVRDTVAEDTDLLTVLARSAPPAAQPAIRDAVAVLRGIDAEARSACPSCSDLPPLQIPGSLSSSTSGTVLGAPSAGSSPGTGRSTTSGRSHAGSTRPGRQSNGNGTAGAHRAAGRGATPAPGAGPAAPPDAGAVGGLLGTVGGLTGGSAPLPTSGTGSQGGAGSHGGSGASGGSSGSGSTETKPGGSGGNGTSSPLPSDPLGDVVGSLLPGLDGDGGLLGN